jgi:hypothetical protein
VILSRNVARLRAEHDALEADFSALLADQRAVRAELAYIRDVSLVQVGAALDSLRRTLDARTEQQV